jgi:hypothetical protein
MSIASATTGGVSGVIGQSNDSSGYGLHAIGRLGSSGTKNFRIDHPDDPEGAVDGVKFNRVPVVLINAVKEKQARKLSRKESRPRIKEDRPSRPRASSS